MTTQRGLRLAEVALPEKRDAASVVAHVHGQPLSHGQWVQRVRDWRHTFAQAEGSEVALHFEDAVAFSAALWGAWHAGKTPVVVSDVQPHTLQCLQERVRTWAGDLPHAVALASENAESSAGEPLRELDMHACRVVMFTSGSTGEPERIVKKLAQFDAEVQALQQAFADADSAKWRVVSTVSHHHIYGLLFRVLWPLSAGRSMGGEIQRYPEGVLRALVQEDAEAAILVSSPAFLSQLPEALPWCDARTRVRRIFSSGGPLPEEASAWCLRLLGQSPVEVFGSTETGGIAWRQRAVHGDAWQLLPGVQVRIQADGLLAVQSAHLPDASAWWDTADRAAVSADGQSFVLQGRVDRIVKIAEKRVSLTAVERALCELAWVRQAKAVVLESAGRSARLGAAVELTPEGWERLQRSGRRAFGRELRQHLLTFVERVALPRNWRYVERMPVNSQSKTTQHDLLRLFDPDMPQVHWLHRSEDSAVAQLYVDARLRVLDGHFPGCALVPGVAQLQWVVRCGQEAFGFEPRFVRIDVLKFQQPTFPGDTVRLELNWDASAQRLQFVLASERGTSASGRLVHEAAGRVA